MFGGGGVLQKNQATYVPYGPDAGHHHIAVGKGSDLNVLWHEAGHTGIVKVYEKYLSRVMCRGGKAS
jgi:hypothetical protein